MKELLHHVLPVCQVRYGLTQLLAKSSRLASLGVELALELGHGGDDLRLCVGDEPLELGHRLRVHGGELVQELRVLPVQLVWGQLAMEVLERLGRLEHARCVMDAPLVPLVGPVRKPAADPPAVDVAHDAQGGCSCGGDLAQVGGDDGEEDHEGLLVWPG
ncbi:hypothetical protein [Corallococcus macrosporus]|uniref:hypothetical protein n=1 Tax=Corallococcus macrosporus TaxID=35 RepID=UPI000F50EB52|nr:hypothetical protein [Corallococcus macrosporus]